jgi:hypothetical protein
LAYFGPGLRWRRSPFSFFQVPCKHRSVGR